MVAGSEPPMGLASNCLIPTILYPKLTKNQRDDRIPSIKIALKKKAGSKNRMRLRLFQYFVEILGVTIQMPILSVDNLYITKLNVYRLDSLIA